MTYSLKDTVLAPRKVTVGIYSSIQVNDLKGTLLKGYFDSDFSFKILALASKDLCLHLHLKY